MNLLPTLVPRPVIQRLCRWAGHTHIVRAQKTKLFLSEVVQSARRWGLDYLGFGSPWDEQDLQECAKIESNPELVETFLRLDPATHNAMLRVERFNRWKAEFSKDGFLFGIDNESPKVRYGHLWWIDWSPDKPFFHDYDQPFDHWMLGNRLTPPPLYARRRIPDILDYQQNHGALGIMAHPTSWWWHECKFITNIAAELPLLLLTGHAPDALVVMGYNADQLYYQKLWHYLIANGFFMPAVAELDWSLDDISNKTSPCFHNLVPLYDGETWSVSLLKQRVREAANVMTSGPVFWPTCANRSPGEHVPAEEAKEIKVSFDDESARPFRMELWRGEKCILSKEVPMGSSQLKLELPHSRDGYYWIKAYGHDEKMEVAISNPFFIGRTERPKPLPRRKLPNPYPEKWVSTLEYLILGRFMKDFPDLVPGEVPPEAFQFKLWRELVSTAYSQ